MNETAQLLNTILRHENTAIETYRHAIERFHRAPYIDVFRENLLAHEARARTIAIEVVRYGGMPTDDSGVWGTFNLLRFDPGAHIHEKAAIASLEDGEDMCRNTYRRQFESAIPPIRHVIRDLLAGQAASHDLMIRLLRGSGLSALVAAHPG